MILLSKNRGFESKRIFMKKVQNEVDYVKCN